MAWQKVRINIGDGYSRRQRDQIAQDIVEFIRNRSESGTGVRKRGRGFQNYRFPGYSKEYIESLDFKIAGKSPRNVNLTLSGDMLIALDHLSSNKDSVLIGYQNGTEENAKAEGNQLGTYGRSSPIPGKKRSFLGIKKSDLDNILDRYERSK